MLDHNGGYVLAAFGITVVVLGGYAAYLRSRLTGMRRRRAMVGDDQSARKVTAAAPIPTTAQAPSSAKGPTAP